MKDFCGRPIRKQLDSAYRILLTESGSARGERTEERRRQISDHMHRIRVCFRTVKGSLRDMKECAVSEDGVPVVMERARDFCDLNRYGISPEDLKKFLSEEGKREALSYAEIACLIPSLEYCCLLRLAELIPGDGSCGELLESLRILSGYDCSTLSEDLSQTEQVLRKDPVYPHLDKASAGAYRDRIRKTAKKLGISERDATVKLLKTAFSSPSEAEGQIGRFLWPEKQTALYFPVFAGMLLAVLLLFLYWMPAPVLFLLSMIPSFCAAKLLTDTIFGLAVSPGRLPRIRITDRNCPGTLVTVTSILKNEKDLKHLIHHMDVLACRIPEKSISLGLLLDFPASSEELSREEAQLLSQLSDEIQSRNLVSPRFFCAVRKRVWLKEEYQYGAPGRKQGALIDFCDLTDGIDSAFQLVCGNVKNAVYLLPLDTDTQPAPGCVEGLIGFMEHPNHAARMQKDGEGNWFVASGYAAAAPRVDANPENSFRTPYSMILAGNAGTEFYKEPHFNLYQDLFSEGIFCGKGILRLECYKKIVASRFRDDPLLSHDLPEGELLRCANLSDLVFYDEIPDNVISDMKRTHRWIRGDFQNIRFLSEKVQTATRMKFKEVCNLFRALEEPCLLLIAALIPFFGTIPLAALLILIFFPLLLRLPFFLIDWLMGRKLRLGTEFLRGCGECLFKLIFLPSRALQAADAAFRGIVRSISGKKRLEWTTAAQSSKGGKEIGDYFCQMAGQQIGLIFLFFPASAVLGAIWILAPLTAFRVSAPYRKDRCEKGPVLEDLNAMWGYFRDFLTEKDNWLPPDNYQQEPLNIPAHRTSPTNIGLAALCILGAQDLKLISEDEMTDLLDRMITTVENLPKWRGHLYNWYDTESLKILNPRFVSSVDCGNCAACFHALKNGLLALGGIRCAELAARIETLLEAADLSVLYDSDKRLFPIGYDVTEEKFSDSYYDLYASEARLTSFYAIMKRQIPQDHWTELARPARQRHHTLQISSWSGTMFEFFMPHLLLPAYRETLSGEMLRGALKAQMTFSGKELPWGISESGYYAFDSLLNYQYRAFGVPELSIRRDLPFSKVIAPYATFLAYPFFPSLAEKNRKKLPTGKYGCYEAVDYRKGSENPRIVKSFMSHHLGMSFLSGVNFLTEKKMQRRFMFREGEAFVSLLTERIPDLSVDYTVKKQTVKERWPSSSVECDRPDPEAPKTQVYSNGMLTEVLTDSGAGYLSSQGVDYTEFSSDPDSPSGIWCFVRNKNSVGSASFAPLYPRKSSYRVLFENGGASYYGSGNGFEMRVSQTLAPEFPVSVREIMIKNNQLTEGEFEYYLYLTPVLCDRRSYLAHPEYKGMFLKTEYDNEARVLSFCRKTEDGEFWLSVHSDRDFLFETRRDQIRPFWEIEKTIPSGAVGSPIYPGLFLKGSMSIRGRGTGAVTVQIACGKSRKEAMDALRRVSAQSADTLRRRFAQASVSDLRAREMSSADCLILNQIVSRSLYPHKARNKAKTENVLPRETFWSYGISGDHPMVCIRTGERSLQQVSAYVKCAEYLERCGIEMDFVFIYRENDGYQTPIRTSLESKIQTSDGSVGKNRFCVNARTPDVYALFRKTAVLFIDLERGWKLREPHHSFRPLVSVGTKPIEPDGKIFSVARGGYTKDGGYRIVKQGKEPYRPWSLVLANRRFGTVLSERSLGWSYAGNASENRLTPRIPGSGYQVSGEKLYLASQGVRRDLIRNASVTFYPQKAVYAISYQGLSLQTEVFVPVSLPVKILKLTARNEDEDPYEIVYEPHILLSGTKEIPLNRFSDGERIYYNNACNPMYPRGTAVLFSVGGRTEGETLRFSAAPKETSIGYFLLGYGSGRRSAEQLAEILSVPGRIETERKKNETTEQSCLHLESPDKDLNFFVNGFLYMQTRNSRIFARTGPSQPGGAFGFRDQLQDCLCNALTEPKLLFRQILRCCSVQFEEGDVLHWWHPIPFQRAVSGIRTRFSDDPFWLVYAAAEYAEISNSTDFFFRKMPFLQADPLRPEERERYFIPKRTERRGTVYEHIWKALMYGLRYGEHGMILFGTGDWNDGMNRIPDGGETVWGTMFALICAQRFQRAIEPFAGVGELEFLQQTQQKLRAALSEFAFRDGYYLRAYWGKDGILGGNGAIDLLPQAFSVFAGLDPEEIRSSLSAAYSRLYDKERKLIRLLDPPYQSDREGFPGTIGEYPPGIRENGGQYTHAAVWFSKALLEFGESELGIEVLSALNPVSHCKTPQEAAVYTAEPYVLCGDVYSHPGREGQGGWSHYTGAAGWYYRVVLENVLGIRRCGDRIFFVPCIPLYWNGCRAEIRVGADRLKLQIQRGTESGVWENGEKVDFISLNGGDHEISIIV